MFNFEKAAEQKITHAIEKGEFKDLKGKGLPLDLDDDIHVPKELKMGFRILKNAGVSPTEIQVLKEINILQCKLKQTDDKNYKQLLVNQIALLKTGCHL